MKFAIRFLDLLLRLSFAFISVHLSSVLSQDESTLRQLFVVYRHGDRSPITLYPKDPNPASVWSDGLGELTNTGKQQQYALGKFLRNYYGYFLTDDLQEVAVRSSDANRCLDSAECNLAAMFQPEGRKKWNPDLNWQPVPVHTTPESEDMLLTTSPNCPEYDKEVERIRNTPKAQEFWKEHEELFQLMTNYSGQSINSLTDVDYLYDTLSIEKRYNLTIPDWNISVWREMKIVQDYSFYTDFCTQISRRLRGGYLLGDIISKMEQKRDKKPMIQKTFIYSTHDTMLAALLSAMGVFNDIAPPYCASVFLELHEIGPHDHVVRVLYRNTTDPESQDKPFQLFIPNCDHNCSLGHFVLLTQDNVPVDWKEECGIQEHSKPFSTTALLVIGTMGLIVFLLLLSTSAMLWLRCQKEKNEVRYQRVPGDINS